MADEHDAGDLRAQLRAGLVDAMKQRDKVAVAAFRTALGVIDNAEAADMSEAPAIEPGHIAGGVAGLGAGEVARRQLTDGALVELLGNELDRWASTAREADRVGRSDDAARLRAEIEVLEPFVTEHEVPETLEQHDGPGDGVGFSNERPTAPNQARRAR